MLYVTITTAEKRSTRGKYETDDPAEAASQAIAKFLTGKPADATVIGVLVEKPGTQMDKGEVAEAMEDIRTAEVERNRQR